MRLYRDEWNWQISERGSQARTKREQRLVLAPFSWCTCLVSALLLDQLLVRPARGPGGGGGLAHGSRLRRGRHQFRAEAGAQQIARVFQAVDAGCIEQLLLFLRRTQASGGQR